MIRSTENQKEKRLRPFCQTTGCFDLADVYVVLKETDAPEYGEVSKDTDYQNAEKAGEHEFDGFKLILYLCRRHDNDFKYLIRGSELEISKRCDLDAPYQLT